MVKHPFLKELKEKIINKNNNLAKQRINTIKSNTYYYSEIIKSLKFIIEDDKDVLHVRCGVGYVLNHLNTKNGVGIDDSALQIDEAKKNYPDLNFVHCDIENIEYKGKFDYILITSPEDIVDIQSTLEGLKKFCYRHTKLIIINYNYLWQPLVKLAELLNLRHNQSIHNWVDIYDLNNLLELSDFEPIFNKKTILSPFKIPVISFLLNKFVSRLPLIRMLSMSCITVARPIFEANEDKSVSIIIPCKNEAGNIQDAVERIPDFGSHIEIIFCDDKSTDGTVEKVKEMMEKYPDKDIKLVDGPGICKAENVWTGFDAAKGDILMILDADLTVIPEELPYFYEAIKNNKGEFINGSRLFYPMHGEAMKPFNIIGNKFFSILFSYILDTKIKDTLCGTKVLWRKDYERIKKIRGYWGIQDRWGDYELIFGAAKHHLKTIDLPVHYYERVYGETKMTNRIKNGVIMLKMSIAALFKIKFH